MGRPLNLLLITAERAHALLRERVRRAGRDWRERPEGGYTNETVVITALLVGAAILVIGVIIAKVTAKANSIDLGP